MGIEEMTPEQVMEKATRLGYDPDRYAKDDPKWKSPEDFIAFGEQLTPIMRENNKRLEKKNAELETEIKQIREKVMEFAKMHEQTAKDAYAKALADLKAEKVNALQEQNYEKVVELDEQIAATKAASVVKPEPKPQVTESSPELEKTYTDFLEENPWADDRSPDYNEDMTVYALSVGAMRVKKGLPHTGTDFKSHLDAVSTKVKERFPEYFAPSARHAVSQVDGGTEARGASTNVKAKTYSSLSSEEKAACDFLVETGTFKSREEYLKKYQESERK